MYAILLISTSEHIIARQFGLEQERVILFASSFVSNAFSIQINFCFDVISLV